MVRHSWSVVGFVFALALVASGCKQGEGDRCEVTRDCQDGYFCKNPTADFAGGLCASNKEDNPVDAGAPVDSGAPVVDAGEPDGGADVSDAASAETGETETGETDASGDGAIDTTEDASTDISSEAAPAETAAD